MTDPFIYGIILIPILIAAFCKFFLRMQISWMEWIAQILIGTACLSLVWAVGNATSGYDTEILNGSVQSKEVWRFSCPTNTSNPCRNGYSCNCHEVCTTTGSGKDQTKSCHTECDTCYKYDWEQNWYVNTNVPGSTQIEIDRVDEQGADMPQRYYVVKPGDPASGTHSYKNWVKASAASLYKEAERDAERYAPLIPEYPGQIYDYYRVDRILAVNTTVTNEAAWNMELSKMLARLGPTKQLNMVVVIVGDVGREYAHAARRKWEGFKKNDAVVFIGVDKSGVIQWGETMSWSKKSIFNIEIRNMIEDMKGQNVNSVSPPQFFNAVSAITVRDFERRPMKEFEYLKGDIPAPTWLKVLSAILALGLGIGGSILFHRIDLDAEVMSNFFNRNRYGSFRRF